jgi:hypothetical protein
VNGSDGSSWYQASSRANLLREIQHRFQDKAMMQVRREYPLLDASMLADKQKVGYEGRKITAQCDD